MTLCFPSSFMLVAAMNPCKCGFYGDAKRECRCTPAQIQHYRLPTAAPKEGDKFAFAGQTCQAEALPPDVLASILRTALEERVDQRVLDRVLRQERRIRRELTKRFAP